MTKLDQQAAKKGFVLRELERRTHLWREDAVRGDASTDVWNAARSADACVHPRQALQRGSRVDEARISGGEARPSMMPGVTRRSAELQEADALTRRIRFEMGREIRDARLSGGASLRTAARRVSMSHTQLGRIERGVNEQLTIEQLSRGCTAVGLRLLVRSVPGTGAVLDAAQLALIGRLRSQLPPSAVLRLEVPLPIQGDRRAWDAILDLDPASVPLEAETRLRDLQALGRRCALKLRDGGFDRLVLLVSDTANNRRVLDEYRDDLRAMFPLDTRQVMAALRAGRTPERSGIVVL